MSDVNMLPTEATIRVLVVEDSTPVRVRLIELLEEVPGIEIVGSADDEAGALAMFDRLRPDAAVLDIRIRNGSGLALLDHIKQHARECMVIMLTNLVHQEYRQRCMDAGADHFFEKSREFGRVAKVLRQLWQRKANNNNTGQD